MSHEAPITFNPFLKAEEEDGRPSVLNEYCKKALDRDDVECFWVCFRRSHRWLAKDMKLDASSDSIRLDELRKIFGWWKRRSFYSTVGVKEVMIRFLSCSAKDEIGVAVIDFDYAGIQRDLDKSINFHLEKDIEHLECGVNIKGEASCSTPCQNLIYDDSLSPYCLVRHIRELSLRRENYKYLPSMLEYYWQNGIDKNAVKFLRDGQFVTQYKYLATEKFSEAENPYGKTVYAFMVVEGWHIRYMLLLVLAGFLCSFCVVAISTAVSQSLEVGLTAGSYTLGIATLFLAIMSFLSAVL